MEIRPWCGNGFGLFKEELTVIRGKPTKGKISKFVMGSFFMNEMSFKRTTETLTKLLALHIPCHSS
jgi:hypothetical protein